MLRGIVGLGSVVGLLMACSSGDGGGSGSTEPPAFTDLAGSRWAVTDTATGNNSCGIPAGTKDSYVVHVLAQSGSSLTIYDERAGAANAVTATLSGHTLSFSGSRYPVLGCSSMTGNYTATLGATGQSFSGTATVTCVDNGCSAAATVQGNRI